MEELYCDICDFVFHFIELIVRHVLILATAGIMHFCSFTSEEHSARKDVAKET